MLSTRKKDVLLVKKNRLIRARQERMLDEIKELLRKEADEQVIANALKKITEKDLFLLCESLEAEKILVLGNTWGLACVKELVRVLEYSFESSKQRSYTILDRHLLATKNLESFSFLLSSFPIRWRRAETVVLHPFATSKELALCAAKGAFPGHSFGEIKESSHLDQMLLDSFRSFLPNASFELLSLAKALFLLSYPEEMIGDVFIALSTNEVQSLSKEQILVLDALARSPIFSECSAGFHLHQVPKTAQTLNDDTKKLDPKVLETFCILIKDTKEPRSFEELLEMAVLVAF